MASVVFVFGAGASADVCVPTMANFRNCLEAAARQDQEEWLRPLLDRIAVPSTEQDLEKIWSRLDMAVSVGVPCVREKYPSFVNAVAQALAHCESRSSCCGYSRLLCKLQGHSSIGGACHLRDDSIAFITFNYDLALDEAYYRAFGAWPRYWIGRPDDNNSCIGPKLLKLHGSLNWGVCDDDACGSGIRMFGSFHELHCMLRCKPCAYHGEDKSRKHRPLIVPPSWLKAPHGHELRRVWAQAHAELRDAKLVIVVGHSWPETDLHWGHMLSLAFASGRGGVQFLVVNSCHEHVCKYCKSLRSDGIVDGDSKVEPMEGLFGDHETRRRIVSRCAEVLSGA